MTSSVHSAAHDPISVNAALTPNCASAQARSTRLGGAGSGAEYRGAYRLRRLRPPRESERPRDASLRAVSRVCTRSSTLARELDTATQTAVDGPRVRYSCWGARSPPGSLLAGKPHSGGDVAPG